jgi:GMP synthase (glutamine-hydrolysing)
MHAIAVLDFGGQYAHLIARRLRELRIYSMVLPGDTKKEELSKLAPKGLVLSGGPASAYAKNAPKCDSRILKLGIPILGICYGHQLLAKLAGGKIAKGKNAEYGKTELSVLGKSLLLSGLKEREVVWMNHRDAVAILPEGFNIIASTKNCSIAAFENNKAKLYGVQFHPEVTHTANGKKVLANFAFKICKAKPAYRTEDIIRKIVREAKQTIGNKKAIIGLSSGIDSSTAAMLVHRAIGKRLIAVYVDTGLMRYRETELVKRIFSKAGLNLHIVDAKQRFFDTLRGVRSPEKKRKIIGKLFVEIFEEIADQEKAEFLIQGTIYSDRIESGITKHSSRIKSHHNVGALPKKMRLRLYEPLRDLYKDEVRAIAKKLGLPNELIKRHVFPGPGLAVRIAGSVTPKKAAIVRKASYIVEEELKKAGLYDKVWMGFAILLPVKSVGIQGDARTYKYVVVVRIVCSEDAMTANFAKIPFDVLERISTRITNEIASVNRVLYDITNKPPATMEWE